MPRPDTGWGKGGSDFDPKGKSDLEVMRFRQAPEFKGKTIMVILPDSGERCLSTMLCE